MKRPVQHIVIIALLGTVFQYTRLGLLAAEWVLSPAQAAQMALFSSYCVAVPVWLTLFKLLRPTLCVFRWFFDVAIRGLDALTALDALVCRSARRLAQVGLKKLEAMLAEPGDEHAAMRTTVPSKGD